MYRRLVIEINYVSMPEQSTANQLSKEKLPILYYLQCNTVREQCCCIELQVCS